MPDRASIGHSRDRNSDRAHLLLAQNRNKMRCRRPAKPVWHSRCASNFCPAFRSNACCWCIRISRLRAAGARGVLLFHIEQRDCGPFREPLPDSRRLRFALLPRARSFVYSARRTRIARARAPRVLPDRSRPPAAGTFTNICIHENASAVNHPFAPERLGERRIVSGAPRV